MIGGQIPLLTTIIYVKYGKFGLESEEDVNRRCETFHRQAIMLGAARHCARAITLMMVLNDTGSTGAVLRPRAAKVADYAVLLKAR